LEGLNKIFKSRGSIEELPQPLFTSRTEWHMANWRSVASSAAAALNSETQIFILAIACNLV